MKITSHFACEQLINQFGLVPKQKVPTIHLLAVDELCKTPLAERL